jgi:hypothetical protein
LHNLGTVYTRIMAGSIAASAASMRQGEHGAFEPHLHPRSLPMIGQIRHVLVHVTQPAQSG